MRYIVFRRKNGINPETDKRYPWEKAGWATANTENVAIETVWNRYPREEAKQYAWMAEEKPEKWRLVDGAEEVNDRLAENLAIAERTKKFIEDHDIVRSQIFEALPRFNSYYGRQSKSSTFAAMLKGDYAWNPYYNVHYQQLKEFLDKAEQIEKEGKERKDEQMEIKNETEVAKEATTLLPLPKIIKITMTMEQFKDIEILSDALGYTPDLFISKLAEKAAEKGKNVIETIKALREEYL